MDIKSAARLIRKQLMTLDEPLKAYYLLKELSLDELKPELNKSYGAIRHLFEPSVYRRIYAEDSCENYEKIEPEEKALEAENIYARYEWVLAEIKKNKAKSFIDLGCYVGSMVLTAAAKYGIRAVGVDYTKKAIEIARERAKKFKVEGVEFIQANAVKYKDNRKFDIVSAFEILEHVAEPADFIKNLLNLVSDNGSVYITTPDGPYDRGWGNRGFWEWDGEGVRGHVRVFTPETVKELIESCNGHVNELKVMSNGIIWIKFKKKND